MGEPLPKNISGEPEFRSPPKLIMDKRLSPGSPAHKITKNTDFAVVVQEKLAAMSVNAEKKAARSLRFDSPTQQGLSSFANSPPNSPMKIPEQDPAPQQIPVCGIEPPNFTQTQGCISVAGTSQPVPPQFASLQSGSFQPATLDSTPPQFCQTERVETISRQEYSPQTVQGPPNGSQLWTNVMRYRQRSTESGPTSQACPTCGMTAGQPTSGTQTGSNGSPTSNQTSGPVVPVGPLPPCQVPETQAEDSAGRAVSPQDWGEVTKYRLSQDTPSPQPPEFQPGVYSYVVESPNGKEEYTSVVKSCKAPGQPQITMHMQRMHRQEPGHVENWAKVIKSSQAPGSPGPTATTYGMVKQEISSPEWISMQQQSPEQAQIPPQVSMPDSFVKKWQTETQRSPDQ